jgi:hypothetical protein
MLGAPRFALVRFMREGCSPRTGSSPGRGPGTEDLAVHKRTEKGMAGSGEGTPTLNRAGNGNENES